MLLILFAIELNEIRLQKLRDESMNILASYIKVFTLFIPLTLSTLMFQNHVNAAQPASSCVSVNNNNSAYNSCDFQISFYYCYLGQTCNSQNGRNPYYTHRFHLNPGQSRRVAYGNERRYNWAACPPRSNINSHSDGSFSCIDW